MRMDDHEWAVEIRGVKQNRKRFSLGPLDLNIPQGYVTAIIGPNGSGKSSTFRLLLGQSKPDAGEMSILGTPVGEFDDTELKRRIGYLAEESQSPDDRLRASDKASFTRAWYPAWDDKLYRELLRLFEIDEGMKLGRMSKGMRRKFDLALALSHAPELLLLDEPSSGLDPLAWKQMIDILHRYMEREGRTIMIASHIVEEVRRLADYIVIMSQGRVLGQYEKDELFSSWHVVFLYREGLDAKQAEQLPGQSGVTAAGKDTMRVVTSKLAEIERWCEEHHIRIVSMHKMELDDILAAMIQRDRMLTI
ncbi:ABC transporter ATP-binding protein [Paenibacillus sp. GCM10023252]|uniref:ABC transporter ATP-binding protein n=1 Tax=Paenibacillus sp. GCM10023252 TaxID=3252649 RepID=UPI003621D557